MEKLLKSEAIPNYLVIIHTHSLRLRCSLYKTNSKLSGNVIGITFPTIFQIFNGNINICSYPRKVILLWFTILVGEGSSRDFHLAIPIVMAVTLWVQEPMWGFCQILSMFIPAIIPQLGK